MSRHREAGVTLIEILIAVSLLSLLSVGILTAMHLGLSTMDKTDARMVRNRRVVNARKILEGEINGFVNTMALYRSQPTMSTPVAFLQAEPQSMRFVSTYSLQDAWRGRAQITALQILPGEKNEGVRLIVDETPYTGPAQAGMTIDFFGPDPETRRMMTHFLPIQPGPSSFVLADRLSYCRFAYLERIPAAPFQEWHSAWTQGGLLPLGIRLEMAPLDEKSTDLHVSTVTVPLSVNSIPGAFYAD
jgi:prepilin-type N-terminal cleavage/methylation domain-containing protein